MQKSLERFDCPHCGAKYRLMKFEADATTQNLQITCRSCGGPLHAREGVFAFKYFMVDRPKVQAQVWRAS